MTLKSSMPGRRLAIRALFAGIALLSIGCLLGLATRAVL
jgi:hypothetical protein